MIDYTKEMKIIGKTKAEKLEKVLYSKNIKVLYFETKAEALKKAVSLIDIADTAGGRLNLNARLKYDGEIMLFKDINKG